MPLYLGENVKTKIVTKYLRFDPKFGWVEDKINGFPYRIQVRVEKSETQEPE